MVDVIDIVKAKVSNRRTGAVNKMLDTLFDKARDNIQTGNVEDGLDLIENVLERGERHAEKMLAKEGYEGGVDHPRVETLREDLNLARDMGDVSEALNVVDDVELWIKDKWSGDN